jgi:uncharacterized membrane protein YeaQ/YmgE (transglycosylase-associated protein family)
MGREREMAVRIEYLLAYIIIGIIAGLISKRYMIESEKLSRGRLVIVGVIAALAFGVGSSILLQFGRVYETHYGWRYKGSDANIVLADLRPDLWLTLIGAAIGALVAIAAYKLLRDREEGFEA